MFTLKYYLSVFLFFSKTKTKLYVILHHPAPWSIVTNYYTSSIETLRNGKQRFCCKQFCRRHYDHYERKNVPQFYFFLNCVGRLKLTLPMVFSAYCNLAFIRFFLLPHPLVTINSTKRRHFLLEELKRTDHKARIENDFITYNKRSVLRRQSRDTNRNINRSVYCQYGQYSVTFRALALRQRENQLTSL